MNGPGHGPAFPSQHRGHFGLSAQTELFQSIDSRWDFVSGNTVYTADELASLVEEHTDTLTQFEGVNSDLDPEKANVITGGAPAGTDAPKENADTGR